MLHTWAIFRDVSSHCPSQHRERCHLGWIWTWMWHFCIAVLFCHSMSQRNNTPSHVPTSISRPRHRFHDRVTVPEMNKQQLTPPVAGAHPSICWTRVQTGLQLEGERSTEVTVQVSLAWGFILRMSPAGKCLTPTCLTEPPPLPGSLATSLISGLP